MKFTGLRALVRSRASLKVRPMVVKTSLVVPPSTGRFATATRVGAILSAEEPWNSTAPMSSKVARAMLVGAKRIESPLVSVVLPLLGASTAVPAPPRPMTGVRPFRFWP